MNKILPVGFEISHLDKIGGTPVMSFLMSEVEKLRQADLAGPTDQLNWDDAAFYIRNPLQPEYSGVIAALTYRHNDWRAALSVQWGAVHSGYRRRGFSTILIGKIEEKAVELKCFQITRSTYVGNEKMRRAMIAQGYSEIDISYKKVLPFK